jgi:two-component system alkaline phosphatase synthesis response regulator PhoP
LVLARYSPDTVPYNTLVKEAQGYDLPRLEARDISRWHIHEIRKQLEEDPRHPLYIITVRDFGYRLVV